MTNNTPIQRIRDGAISASIFRNGGGENGVFYSVQFSRSYKDDNGDYQNATSYSGTELLKIGRLAHLAYDAIETLRQSDYADQPAPAAG